MNAAEGGALVPPARPLVSIIGGGAVGGLLAALLARAGCAVELVVRKGYLAAYGDGIQVTMPNGSFRQPLVIRTGPSPGASLLVIAVKMPDLEVTCRDVAAGRPPTGGAPGQADQVEPDVLLLQNGIEALDLAAHYWPSERLFAAVVELGATALTPGEITYSIPGRLLIGPAWRGQIKEAGRIAAMLSPAVHTSVANDIRGAQRLKLLVNLNNGVGAATGLTIQQLYASRAGIKASLGVMREGLAVLDAAGLAPPANRRSRALRVILGLPEPFGVSALRLARVAMRQRAPVYTSTLQSLIRQRPSELPWLNGAVVRLGRQQCVAAPLNSAIVTTVEALEACVAGAAHITPIALLEAGVPRQQSSRTWPQTAVAVPPASSDVSD